MVHVLNLTLRFLLELAGLVAVGYWGFATQQGIALQVLTGIGLPIVLAAMWGIFRVPNDGGAPVVPTPPQLRLLYEAVFFGLAVALLWGAGQGTLAMLLLALVLVNYAIDYRRTWGLASGAGVPPDHLPEAFRPHGRH